VLLIFARVKFHMEPDALTKKGHCRGWETQRSESLERGLFRDQVFRGVAEPTWLPNRSQSARTRVVVLCLPPSPHEHRAEGSGRTALSGARRALLASRCGLSAEPSPCPSGLGGPVGWRMLWRMCQPFRRGSFHRATSRNLAGFGVVHRARRGWHTAC
jgi:hypothetical protein